jgi:hypothetical protein
MARHYAEADKKRNSENGQSEPGFWLVPII